MDGNPVQLEGKKLRFKGAMGQLELYVAFPSRTITIFLYILHTNSFLKTVKFWLYYNQCSQHVSKFHTVPTVKRVTTAQCPLSLSQPWRGSVSHPKRSHCDKHPIVDTVRENRMNKWIEGWHSRVWMKEGSRWEPKQTSLSVPSIRTSEKDPPVTE